jgi:hypothetical protein
VILLIGIAGLPSSKRESKLRVWISVAGVRHK